jgi:uncharacterized protein YoxC
MEKELIKVAEQSGNPMAVLLAVACSALSMALIGLFIYYRLDIAKKDRTLEKRFDQVAGLTEKMSTAINGLTSEIDRLVNLLNRK